MLKYNWQETYGQPHLAFFYVELVCNIWFIIELAIRLVVSAICGFRLQRDDEVGQCSNRGFHFIGFAQLVSIH